MGFIRPTEARRISFEEAQRFGRIHQKTYREHGFEVVPIGPGSVEASRATDGAPYPGPAKELSE